MTCGPTGTSRPVPSRHRLECFAGFRSTDESPVSFNQVLSAPDVLIPGFMKAGSTTVFRWLMSRPEVASGGEKEPNLLTKCSLAHSDYRPLLGSGSGLTVDASVSYLEPAHTPRVAANLARFNPEVRVIIVHRDPIERAVAHVRHNVRRGRLRIGSPAEYATLIRPGQPYFERSRYLAASQALLEALDAPQVLVVPDVSDDEHKWRAICNHVGLKAGPVPIGRANQAASLPRYSGAMRWLSDSGLLRQISGRRAPAPVRWAAKKLLLRPPVETISAQLVEAAMRAEDVAALREEDAAFRAATRTARWAVA